MSIVSRLRAAGCVFAEDEAALIVSTARTPSELEAMVSRRVSGLPLEQVVGWASFCGLRIVVEPGVFVPRRRTEFLVRRAVGLAPADPVVVDLCCGSGAVGAALSSVLRPAEVYAADVDPAAVRCARRNLPGREVYEGDLYDALPASLRGRISVLAANVPYVPTREVALLPAEARDHEPLVALDGGEDGLELLRRVASSAPSWLAPGGVLLFETSSAQAAPAVASVAAAGLVAEVSSDDSLGATVISGVLSRRP